MSGKKQVIFYLSLVVGLLAGILVLVAVIDPFFHYHKPLTALYYTLDNERSQNNGIARHFDFDAVSTGTSLTANTKVSEVDALYGTNAVKATFSGGSFYEISQNLEVAYRNHELTTVVRCLDAAYFRDPAVYLRIDLGEYPDYLYDDDLWNDVYYLYNRDVLFARCLPMLAEAALGRPGGITTFDEYGNWSEGMTYGAKAVLKDYEQFYLPPYSPGLTEEEEATVRENVRTNLVAQANAHPGTTFYFYISPYSAVWWGSVYSSGDFFKVIGAERIVIEELLSCPNVRLYSFNRNTDLTTDLSNYKDALHYGEWVNSDILRWMREGEGLLTKENYEDYLAEETRIYSEFPYNSLFLQED